MKKQFQNPNWQHKISTERDRSESNRFWVSMVVAVVVIAVALWIALAPGGKPPITSHAASR